MSNERFVVVVDDDRGIRELLTDVLTRAGYACQTHASGDSLLNEEPPDRACCMILDLRLPGRSGLELQRELQNTAWADVPVIFLTAHGQVRAAVTALKQGALDFLEKPFDNEMLLTSIEGAFRSLDTTTDSGSGIEEGLTPREREICSHLLVGKTAKMIASDLGVSPRTVEFHRSNIMEKLEVATTPELIGRLRAGKPPNEG